MKEHIVILPDGGQSAFLFESFCTLHIKTARTTREECAFTLLFIDCENIFHPFNREPTTDDMC